MIPKEVCHYTKAETALKILATKRLMIGQLKNTNDPRESRAGNVAIMFEQNAPIAIDAHRGEILDQIRKKAKRIALERWKVLCVSIDGHPKYPQAHHTDMYNFHTEIYNQQIRPAYCNPVMWSHYAEKHKGVCLIFDGRILHQNLYSGLKDKCNILCGQVQYDFVQTVGSPVVIIEKSNINPEEVARDYYYVHYKDLFLRKLPAWKHENEFRWLIYSARQSAEFVSICGAIKALLVGIDFPKMKESKLKNLCEKLKISAGRMAWDNGIATPQFGSIYQP